MEPKYPGGETLYDGYHVGEPLLQKFISLDDNKYRIWHSLKKKFRVHSEDCSASDFNLHSKLIYIKKAIIVIVRYISFALSNWNLTYGWVRLLATGSFFGHMATVFHYFISRVVEYGVLTI